MCQSFDKRSPAEFLTLAASGGVITNPERNASAYSEEALHLHALLSLCFLTPASASARVPAAYQMRMFVCL